MTLISVSVGARQSFEMYTQAGTYYGGNDAVFAALQAQRVDVRFGVGIATSGFILQLFGALAISGSSRIGAVLLVVVIALIFGWRWFRGRVLKRSRIEFKKLETQENSRAR